MFEGKRFLPETGTPMRKMDRMRTLFAVCEPDPLAVATCSEKSLATTSEDAPAREEVSVRTLDMLVFPPGPRPSMAPAGRGKMRRDLNSARARMEESRRASSSCRATTSAGTGRGLSEAAAGRLARELGAAARSEQSGRTSDQVQELFPHCFLEEDSAERGGDRHGARFLDAAHLHAEVPCLDDDHDALGPQLLLEDARDLLGEALLD